MAKEKFPAADEASSSVSFIDHIEVDVEALLGDASMTVAQLNQLAEGDVVRLDRQVNEPVAIRVNGRVIGRGEIVTVNDCFAVRVTQIGE